MHFSITDASKNDVESLAHILVSGWKDSYKNIVDQSWLDSLCEQDYQTKWQNWFDKESWQVRLARTEKGQEAGFISFGKLKTPPPGMSPIRPLYSSEIYAIYLLKEYRSQGLGTKLMKAAADQLADLKHKSMCLWVLEKNKRALNFYKNNMGERCGKRDIEIGPSAAREVCFGWRDTKVLRD